MTKFPITVGIEGIKKNQTMITPSRGEQPVVGFGLHHVAGGGDELHADEARREPSEERTSA